MPTGRGFLARVARIRLEFCSTWLSDSGYSNPRSRSGIFDPASDGVPDRVWRGRVYDWNVCQPSVRETCQPLVIASANARLWSAAQDDRQSPRAPVLDADRPDLKLAERRSVLRATTLPSRTTAVRRKT